MATDKTQLRNLVPACAAVAIVALVCSQWLVGPADGFFEKYLRAAAVPVDELSSRAADFSPAYLFLARLMAGFEPQRMLFVQSLCHAAVAVLVVLIVRVHVGLGWGFVAGVTVATYRPFIVHAGLHEPEALILLATTISILAAEFARAESNSGRAEASRWRVACFWASICGAALGLATLLRPSFLLLAPVWLVWIWRKKDLRRAACFVGVLTVVCAPVVVSNWARTGHFVLMNPGPVFYEGNGPGTTGLNPIQPRVAYSLLDFHSGKAETDYHHVAYRRAAAVAKGRKVDSGESNSYWLSLAVEGLIAHPVQGLKRLAGKALLSISTSELHDTSPSYQYGLRARQRLPWGFGLCLMMVPWIIVALPVHWRLLLGPFGVGVLALLVQIVFYVSARQRLPLALAILVIGPISIGTVWKEVRRKRSKCWGLGLMGVALTVAAAAATGQAAVDLQTRRVVMGPSQSSFGGMLADVHDGTIAYRVQRHRARILQQTYWECSSPQPTQQSARLARMGFQLFWAPVRTGLPEYCAAVSARSHGQWELSREMAQKGAQRRPDDPQINALAFAFRDPPPSREELESWRPPGIDPVSARWLIAEAVGLDSPDRARDLLTPMFDSFPEFAQLIQWDTFGAPNRPRE